MLRLYTPLKLEQGAEVKLEEKAFHHAIHVHRLKKNDELHLFNEREGEWCGKVSNISKKDAIISLYAPIMRAPHAPSPCHLYFCLLKPDRQFFLIEKATELGVTDFFPLQSEFTQNVRIAPEKWLDQAQNATQQCERLDVPRIHPSQSLQKALETLDSKAFACIERMENQDLLCAPSPPRKVFIGPEGGWSSFEKELLLAHPLILPLSLGHNILRAETAAISALTLINFFKGF